MKVFVSILFLVLVFISGCQKAAIRQNIVPISQIMSYPAGNDQFTILVIEDNGVTRNEAKQTARKEAARVALENGYSYFSILSEDETQVVKNSGGQSAQMPSNLYQELIIEKQPGRESLENDQGFSSETYSALRLKIRCYREKPAFKRSINAQDYTAPD